MSTSDEQPSTEATSAPDLDDIAAVSNDAGNYDQITPNMAQELINRCGAITTDLGRLESNNKRADKGYCQVNIKKLRVRSYLPQLALVADNRRAELETTLNSSGIEAKQ
ncbi:hypothetical protein V1522DRAFT_423997 [Lipomyces starkeyi]